MADRFDARDRLPDADRIRERIREQRETDDNGVETADAGFKADIGAVVDQFDAVADTGGQPQGYLEIEEIPGESQRLTDDITGGAEYFKGVDGLKVNDALKDADAVKTVTDLKGADAVKTVTDLKDADAVKTVTDLKDADAVKTVTDLKDADAVKTVVDHKADDVVDPVGEALEPLLGGAEPVIGSPDVESAMDASSPMFDDSDLSDGL